MNRIHILALFLYSFVACAKHQSTQNFQVLHELVPRGPSSLERLNERFSKAQAYAVTHPDLRTEEERVTDACSGSKGWSCKRAKGLAQRVEPAVTPSSWKTGAWYVDGRNISGCASDRNTGISSTCGDNGAGPLLTGKELQLGRWGGVPVLSQITVVTFLSDMAVGDLWYTTPSYGPGGWLSVVGTLQPYYSGIIGTYTALAHGSITTPGTRGTILLPTFNWTTGCGGSCVGAYVLDTTRTPNVKFIIESDQGGGLATITNPFVVGPNPIPAYGVPQNGDSITIGRGSDFVAYSLQNVIPGVTSAAAFTSYQLFTFITPDGFSEINVGGNTWLVDVTLGQNIDLNSQAGRSSFSIFSNCFFPYSQFSGAGHFVGGAIEGNGTSFTDGTILDGDFIIGATTHNSGLVQITRAYSKVANDVDQASSVFIFYPGVYGPSVFYGPGGLVLSFGSRAEFYGSPGIVSTAFLTPILAMGANYQTNSFWFNEATGTWTGPITASVANAASFGALWDPGTGTAFGVIY